LLLWANSRLAFAIGADFGADVYRRTLYQPYQTHLARNSSELISAITTKTRSAVWALHAMLTVVSSTVLLFAILFALVAIDPVMVAIAAIVLGSSYGIITRTSRRRLETNSRRVARESVKVIKALQEGLGGIRDVLLNGAQPVFCETYEKANFVLQRAESSSLFIGTSPRPAMEAVGIVMISGLAYYGLNRQAGGVATALPVLGALAMGAQRLLPALQQLYANWVSIVSNRVALAEVLDLLDQPLPEETFTPDPPPLEFSQSIIFESVFFRYLDNGPWVLNGLNLSMPKGLRIGLVGETGTGKSTALDIMMGLLEPTRGVILVDGVPVNGERRRSWQRAIAHVPQSIFLADTTLAENIAFGVSPKEIDMQRVRKAALQAQIADFVESGPDGYQALIGERGIRLSGGQRQRIGIARALYRQASVLVLDEATSSLDNTTEQSVMEAIEALDRDLTIVIIAHRLSTVQRCDQIIELAHGKVIAQGTYEELLEKSPSFRQMAMVVAEHSLR
ncbi:MAG: ABC transporter ATP-binding protein, partial [Pseudomonadota bacterium]